MAQNRLTSRGFSTLTLRLKQINSRHLTWIFSLLALASAMGIGYEMYKIREMNAFNIAVTSNKTPATQRDSFETKFASAYWLAKKDRFKESARIFSALSDSDKTTPAQRTILLHNIGNTYFLRAIELNGSSATARPEVEYQLNQAKTAYMSALKIDPSHWGTKHNLDRLNTMLPGTPTPGVGESDNAGLILGNIPVGLP